MNTNLNKAIQLFIKRKYIKQDILQYSINKTNLIRKDFDKIYSKLSVSDMECLSFYKGFGYIQINEFLYNKDLSLDIPDNPISISDHVNKSYETIINYKNLYEMWKHMKIYKHIWKYSKTV